MNLKFALSGHASWEKGVFFLNNGIPGQNARGPTTNFGNQEETLRASASMAHR